MPSQLTQAESILNQLIIEAKEKHQPYSRLVLAKALVQEYMSSKVTKGREAAC